MYKLLECYIYFFAFRPEFGELVVLYKCGRGAYSESGAMFTACHTLMPQYNTIGVYYDDPSKVTNQNNLGGLEF